MAALLEMIVDTNTVCLLQRESLEREAKNDPGFGWETMDIAILETEILPGK